MIELTHADSTSGAVPHLVVGSRQLTVVLFFGVVVLGMFATVAYLVGRLSTPETQPPAAAARKAPEQVIVVEPAVKAVVAKPAPPTLPATPLVTPSPAAAAAAQIPPKPVSIPRPAPIAPGDLYAPAQGMVFLQVAAVDRGMAEVSVEYLTRRGFVAKAAASPEAGMFRVLVGPLNGNDDIARNRGNLQAAGFQPFLQQY